MEKVVKRFGKVINVSMLSLIVDILIGALLLFLSDEFAFNSNFVVVGVLMLVKGLASLIRYVYDGLGNKFFLFDLFTGIIGVVLGLFTCLSPFIKDLTLEYSNLGLLFGIYMISYALSKLYYAFIFKKMNEDIYPLVFMTGLLFFIIGLICIFNPLHSFVAYLIGVLIIAYGVLELNYYMLLRKKAKNIIKYFDK